MDCSCLRGELSLNVKPLNCEALRLTDLSEWMNEDGYIVPTSYPITITDPTGIVIDASFIPTSENILSKETLGTLKDGIYCFSVDNCGTIYTFQVAITCNLECRLVSLYSKAEEDEDFDLITKIERNISFIRANAKFNNVDKAKYWYDVTRRILDNHECDC